MGISVKPSSKDTTGIGPASDRRRARRTGRMGWRAAVHCVAAFDVPRPTKNPRRLALQVSIMGAIPWRRWRISTRDRPPSSTFRHRGRSSVLCCLLSRRACSLSSAGNVCWAKPNHGFFNCQQPDAKKFSQPADAVRDRDRCARTMPRSRCMRGMTPETAASRKTSGKHMFHRRRANAIAHVAHVVRSQATACGRMPGTNQGMRNEATRTSRFARRTSRFARKCANFFAPAIHGRHPSAQR